jgi:hypothetical protein
MALTAPSFIFRRHDRSTCGSRPLPAAGDPKRETRPEFPCCPCRIGSALLRPSRLIGGVRRAPLTALGMSVTGLAATRMALHGSAARASEALLRSVSVRGWSAPNACSLYARAFSNSGTALLACPASRWALARLTRGIRVLGLSGSSTRSLSATSRGDHHPRRLTGTRRTRHSPLPHQGGNGQRSPLRPSRGPLSPFLATPAACFARPAVSVASASMAKSDHSREGKQT